MASYIHCLETLLPPHCYAQKDIAAMLQKNIVRGDRRKEKIIHQLFARSGIEQRHSVVADLLPDSPSGIFFDRETGALLCPSTGERNALYTESARGMFTDIAREILAKSGFAPSELTHLITVSCTGFFQPGPDFAILEALGLHAGVERYHLGFMGCYAAFPALRMAKAFCESNPDAVVLVVCLELCTLHVQWTAAPDDLLAGAVFADGASAALVSARIPSGPALRLDAFASAIAPAGEADMAWTIGDTGFRMRLSTYIPEIIQTNLSDALAPLLSRARLTQEQITHWAIHPGGRAILDRVESGLGLPKETLGASREVLRTCGNMSSATILFVLKELQARGLNAGETVLPMSFGPGLTIETGLLTVV